MRPRAKTIPWIRQQNELAVALNPVPTDLRYIADPDGSAEWLLENADGSKTLDELVAASNISATAINASLATLNKAGLLIDTDALSRLDAEEREQWRNNLGFFEAYSDLAVGPTVHHDRLRAARVLILGAGGLGSMVLMNLVGLGVDEIVVVDFDRVEAANFSRQFIYRRSDINGLKVERAGEWVKEFSVHTRVTTIAQRIDTVDDIAVLLEGIDLVVSAIDQPIDASLMVNEACYRANVPSIYGGFFFTKGRYESVWPGHSPCLACLVVGELFQLEPINRATGPSVSIVGGLMALEAVRYLTGFAPPAAAARSWIVDFPTGAVSESVRWGRSAECPICGDPPNPAAEIEPQEDAPSSRGLTLASVIDVRHLTIQPDGAEFIVGDLSLAIFVTVPAVGAIVLEALQSGATVAEATEAANNYTGVDVNVLDFVRDLQDNDLIRPGAQADRVEEQTREPSIVTSQSWRTRVVHRVARVVLSVPALIGYLAIFLTGLSILLVNPGLRPNWESIIFLPDPALALLINLVTVLGLAGFHELFHWLGARRLGLPASLRVSRRGVFLVFETDLTRLWAVPRRQRYVAFLAGMAFDGTVLGFSLIARAAQERGLITLPDAFDRYLGVVILTEVIALIAQVPLFMRTDLYAILVSALRCHNLYRVSMLLVKQRLIDLSTGERAELTNSSERDLQVGRWFSSLYLIGVLGLAYLLCAYFIPATMSIIVWSVQNVLSTDPTSLVFWEALPVAVFFTVELLWPSLSWSLDCLRRLAAARRTNRMELDYVPSQLP